MGVRWLLIVTLVLHQGCALIPGLSCGDDSHDKGAASWNSSTPMSLPVLNTTIDTAFPKVSPWVRHADDLNDRAQLAVY